MNLNQKPFTAPRPTSGDGPTSNDRPSALSYEEARELLGVMPCRIDHLLYSGALEGMVGPEGAAAITDWSVWDLMAAEYAAGPDLSSAKAATMLGTDPRRVRYLLERGVLGGRRDSNGRWLISRHSVDVLLDGNAYRYSPRTWAPPSQDQASIADSEAQSQSVPACHVARQGSPATRIDSSAAAMESCEVFVAGADVVRHYRAILYMLSGILAVCAAITLLIVLSIYVRRP